MGHGHMPAEGVWVATEGRAGKDPTPSSPLCPYCAGGPPGRMVTKGQPLPEPQPREGWGRCPVSPSFCPLVSY